MGSPYAPPAVPVFPPSEKNGQTGGLAKREAQ